MKGNKIRNLQGEQGGMYVDASDGLIDVKWTSFVCVTDVVLTAIEQPLYDNENRLVGLNLEANKVIFGGVSKIHVQSGLIQGFNAVNKGIQERL